MPRFLRSHGESRLRAPVVLFSPLQPPVETTILVSLVVQARRVSEKQRFPLQGWEQVPCDEPSQGSSTGFPYSSLLTSFSGSNENPLSEGGNWSTSTVRVGEQRPQLLANKVQANAGVANEAIWANSFQADQEVWATMVDKAANGSSTRLFARIQNEGTSSCAAYVLTITPQVGTDQIRVSRLSNVTFNQINTGTLGATMDREVAAGDSFGLSVIGNTISVYYMPVGTGSWTLIGQGTDPGLSGAGRIGLGILGGDTATWDAFGGGGVTGLDVEMIYQQRFLGPKPPRIILGFPDSTETAIRTEPGSQLAVISRRVTGQQRQPHSKLLPLQQLAQPPPGPYGPSVAPVRTRPRSTTYLLRGPLLTTRAPGPRQASIQITLARARVPRPTTYEIRPPVAAVTPALAPPVGVELVAVARARRRQTIQDWAQDPTAPAGISRVAAAGSASDTLSTATITVPLSGLAGTVPAGDLLLGYFASANGVDPLTVIDTQGNSWTRVHSRAQGATNTISLWTLQGGTPVGPSDSVTATWAAANTRKLGGVEQYTGFGAALAVYDQRAGNGSSGSPTVLDDGTTGVLVDGWELVVCANNQSIATATSISWSVLPAGFSNGINVANPAASTNRGMLTAYQIRASDTTAANPAGTSSIAGFYTGITVTIRALTADPIVLRRPFIGPRPPLLLAAPPPTQAQQTPSINSLPPDRLARRFRRQLPVLGAPVIPTAAVFYGPQVNLLPVDRLARRHRRHNISWFLGAPTVVRVPSVEQQQQTIRTALVRARRGAPYSRLFPPIAPSVAVFYGPAVELRAVDRVQAGYQRRNPYSRLAFPSTLEPFSVALRERTLLLRLQAVNRVQAGYQRRGPYSKLSPPATLEPFAVAARERTITTRLVAVARVSAGNQRRAPYSRLYPAQVVRVPSVEQHQQTVGVWLVRIRPRRTAYRLTLVAPVAFIAPPIGVTLVVSRRARPPHRYWVLGAPVVILDAFRAPRITTTLAVLPQARPRPTRHLITPPTLVVAFISQRDQTIRTSLATGSRFARPRQSRAALAPPTVLQVFTGPSVTRVQTRPRPTSYFVAPPATLESAAVQLAERTIRVALVRARPRPTGKRLQPPTVVRVPSVEQREQTITVALVRVRPRPTTRALGRPAALQIFYGPATSLIAPTRGARRVHRTQAYFLNPPIAAPTPAAFAGPEVVLAAVKARLVQRRRKIILWRPQSVFVFAPLGAIRTTLVQTRPRATTKVLGEPLYLSPLAVTTTPGQLGVKTTFTADRQRSFRLQRRTRYYLYAPQVLAQPPPAAVLSVNYLLPDRLARRFRRQLPTSALGTPTVLQVFTGPVATLARVRPRRTAHFLAPPVVVRIPSVEQREQTISIALVRARPRPTTRFLAEPTTLQVFAGPQVNLLPTDRFNRRHRRGYLSFLAAPTQIAQPIPTAIRALVRAQPRPTSYALGGPFYLNPLAVVTTPGQLVVRTALIRTRPRPTTKFVQPPSPYATLLAFTPYPVRVTLVRTRPRPTTKTFVESFYLSPLAAVTTPGQLVVRATLVRTRPRPTTRTLGKPTVLQVFAGPQVLVTRTRPRPTRRFLAPPAVVRIPSVEQREQTIQIALVRTRPRPTSRFFVESPYLSPLAVVTTPGQLVVRTTLVRTQPRPTTTLLSPPPQVVAFPFVFVPYPIRVSLVRTRPRPTRTFVAPPTVLQIFLGPVETEVAVRVPVEDRRRLPHSRLLPPAVVRVPSVEQREQTIGVWFAVPRTAARPRPTSRFLKTPTLIRVPSVEQQQQTIRVALVRIRPRPTTKTLGEPTTLQEFFGPVETEVAVRVPLEDKRRGTHYRLTPPTVIRTPSVEQQQQTVAIHLVRTRPRPTVHLLLPPTVLQTFAGPRITLTRARPRPTRHYLTPPTLVRVPSVEQLEQTIRVALVRTKPRLTVHELAPPTVVIPPPSLREQTVRVTLAGRTRVEVQRREPVYRLQAPIVVVINPPVVTRILVSTVQERTPREWPRHFPLQGWLGTWTQITPSPNGIALVQGLIGPFRPKLTTVYVTPLANPIAVSFETTVKTRLQVARRPSYRLAPPTVTAVVFAGPRIALTRTRPRPTAHVLSEPTVLQVFAGPRVSLTQIRPRPTRRVLEPPTLVRIPSVEQAEQTIRVVTVRTRPRPKVAILHPPATLEPYSIELREQTVRVTFVQTRPRPKSAVVRGPATLEPFSVELREQTIRVTLVRARPRPQVAVVRPPATLEPFAVELREQTIRIVLTRTRPRPTAHELTPPTVLQTFVGPRTPLARTRPRPTTWFLAPPTVLLTFIGPRTPPVRTRPRPTTHRLAPPVVLQTFGGPETPLVRTRPRPTRHYLTPPTVVRVPSVEQAEQTIQVRIVRTRPRPTTRRLAAPTVLQVFAGAEVTTVSVRTVVELVRHRPTSNLAPPTIVLATAAEIAANVLRTRLTRIRPRPTVVRLLPPILAVTYPGPSVTRARIRPARTRWFLRAPQVVRVPSIEQAEQTIRTQLAWRTRSEASRRAPHSHLSAPTVLRTFAGPIVHTSLANRLSRLQRGPMVVVSPPTVVAPPPPATLQQQTIRVTTVAVATRAGLQRRAPHSVLRAPTRVIFPVFLSDTGVFNFDTLTPIAGRPVTDTGATVSDAITISIVRHLTDTGSSITDSIHVGQAFEVSISDVGASITDSITVYLRHGGRATATIKRVVTSGCPERVLASSTIRRMVIGGEIETLRASATVRRYRAITDVSDT